MGKRQPQNMPKTISQAERQYKINLKRKQEADERIALGMLLDATWDDEYMCFIGIRKPPDNKHVYYNKRGHEIPRPSEPKYKWRPQRDQGKADTTHYLDAFNYARSAISSHMGVKLK